MDLKKLFRKEKHHTKGLMALEWVIVVYAAITMVIVLFGIDKLRYPDAMIETRVRLVAITLGMWAVYKLVPCRLTRLARVVVQMGLLSWWYTDTYYLNCLFPNLDHLFAQVEQHLFGCQPALQFAIRWPQIVVSEMMDMAYASYFPIIATTALYYFFKRYRDFEWAAFVIMASFFSFYIIYDLLHVVGPMYYYKAVGPDQITTGVFPAVGHYFSDHLEMMTSPGYADGVFYNLLHAVHSSGERPTAAFPSSHVGISVLCLLLAWHTRSRRLFFSLLPFAVLICFATVYIRAHYVIDVFAGLFFGVAFYAFWAYTGRRMKI